MSFILDALRKSEGERQLQGTPDVMRVPLAMQRDRLPTWAILLMIAMAVAILSLSFVWLRDADLIGGTARNVAGTGVRPEVEMGARLGSPSEVITEAETGAPRTADLPASAAAATGPERRETVQPSESTPPARANPAQSTPARVPPAIEAAALPSAAQLIAEGISLPSLDLQLHVNSSSSAGRFVIINGNRYREGERLAEGPTVVAINAEGAVLSYLGREFLISPD